MRACEWASLLQIWENLQRRLAPFSPRLEYLGALLSWGVGAPGNSTQVSKSALKWRRFLLPGHWLPQDCPPVAYPANHQKWPRGTRHHTTSDSNTTPPCRWSQDAKSSQSEALQMPCEHGQWRRHPAGLEETRQIWAASLPLRKGRNMGAINTQTGLLTAREGHEVCSKLSRDRRRQIHRLICNHLNMTFSNHFPQTHRKYILLLDTKGKHLSHFLNRKVVSAHKRDVKQCKIVIY